jgi:hypothetical protein
MELTMKLKTVCVGMLYLLPSMLLTTAATCYDSDWPNVQDCGKTGETECSVVVNGLTYKGQCSTDVYMSSLKVVDEGYYKVENVTCHCKCRYWIDLEWKTQDDAPNTKEYEKLSSSKCPE